MSRRYYSANIVNLTSQSPFISLQFPDPEDSFLVFCDVKRRWNIYRRWSAASSHEPCYRGFIYFLVMSSEDVQYQCSYCRILSGDPRYP